MRSTSCLASRQAITVQIDNVRKIAAANDIQIDDGKDLRNAAGQTLVGFLIHHGDHRLLAVQGPGHVLLSYRLRIERAAAESLASIAEPHRSKVFATLVREVLEGPNGYQIQWADEEKMIVFAVLVEQRLLVPDTGPEVSQRLLDSIQTLVNLGVRLNNFVGLAMMGAQHHVFSSSSGSKSTAPDSMYH